MVAKSPTRFIDPLRTPIHHRPPLPHLRFLHPYTPFPLGRQGSAAPPPRTGIRRLFRRLWSLLVAIIPAVGGGDSTDFPRSHLDLLRVQYFEQRRDIWETATAGWVSELGGRGFYC